MRALVSANLAPNPWLLGTLLGVLALFVTVLLLSLRPTRSRELERESRLPFND
jgi:hypothetical protein